MNGFVDAQRIQELRTCTSSEFDLSRLLALCEELNVAWSNRLWHAASALTRAILDHVPPIFGCKSFSEVANNYAGTKSFRETMQFLEKAARKIADAHLHSQVREAEVLPTPTQVNFAGPLDVLLAEVVRIAKLGDTAAARLRAIVARAVQLNEDFLCPDCGLPILKREPGVGWVSTDLGEYDVVWEDVSYECGRATHDGEEMCRAGGVGRGRSANSTLERTSARHAGRLSCTSIERAEAAQV